MRRVAVILTLLVSAGLALGQRPAGTNTLVFVLGGQSNMVGHGRTSELPDDLRKTPPNVSYFPAGKKADFESQGGTFGPEVGFAHEIARAHPDKSIVIIKYAMDGTSLLAWAPQWNAERAALTWNRFSGRLYEKMMKIVHEVPEGTNAVPFAGILWMQGERDAYYRQAAREYGSNLRTLVSAFRRDLKTPDLPFVMGLVNPPGDTHPALDEVRQAQQEAEKTVPNIATVSTDGLGKLGDSLHYDTQGQIELGRRFARIYLELVRKNARPDVEKETARGGAVAAPAPGGRAQGG